MPNGEPAMPGTVELDLHSFRDRIAEPPDLPAVIEEYFAHPDTETALSFVFIGKETGEEKVRGKRYVAGFDRKTAIFLCIQNVFVNISVQRGTDKNLCAAPVSVRIPPGADFSCLRIRLGCNSLRRCIC